MVKSLVQSLLLDPNHEPLPPMMALCQNCGRVSHMNHFAWIMYKTGLGYYGAHKQCLYQRQKPKYTKPSDTLF